MINHLLYFYFESLYYLNIHCWGTANEQPVPAGVDAAQRPHQGHTHQEGREHDADEWHQLHHGA